MTASALPFNPPVVDPPVTRIQGDLVAQLPQLRAALLQQRVFRVHQLAELAREAGSSWATHAERDVNRALRASAAAALADIEAALERMSTGHYGACWQCDGAIPLERLEILPSVSLCMPCQYTRDVRPD